MIKISVCLASYNGEHFIMEQILSILNQIGEHDELLISDDCSTDQTINVIESIKDDRITLIKNINNMGYIKNFEKILKKAKGKYIFLSDQDDIWAENRVRIMINAHKISNKKLIIGDFAIFTASPPPYCQKNSALKFKNCFPLSNLFRIFFGFRQLNNYGSCMLIHRDALEYIIPFSKPMISHDVYIALSSNIFNDACYISNIVTHRRIHDNNITRSNRPLIKKIFLKMRWILIVAKIFLKKHKLSR